MLSTILIVVCVVVVLVLGVIALRPPVFHLERSMVTKAPPERVFALINDFRLWPAWSPWENIDPAMKKTFAGPATGTGAVYSWDGNKKVGAGRMTIANTEPPGRIDIKLDFFRPFPANNTTTFTMVHDQFGTTKVTWAMDGRNNFAAKAFQLVMSMDAVVGKDFAKGLAALKAAAERG